MNPENLIYFVEDIYNIDNEETPQLIMTSYWVFTENPIPNLWLNLSLKFHLIMRHFMQGLSKYKEKINKNIMSDTLELMRWH